MNIEQKVITGTRKIQTILIKRALYTKIYKRNFGSIKRHMLNLAMS